ncbi:hypothetical protein FOPE_07742 [Fonsecaea pedrosoi]|nr:hypothetical protein FOPE_07742 [Fonsecaea pedrosoi]
MGFIVTAGSRDVDEDGRHAFILPHIATYILTYGWNSRVGGVCISSGDRRPATGEEDAGERSGDVGQEEVIRDRDPVRIPKAQGMGLKRSEEGEASKKGRNSVLVYLFLS